MSIAVNEYAARYFNGGTTPSVVLHTENPDLSQEDADLIKQKWLMHYGGRSRAVSYTHLTLPTNREV